MINLAVGFLLWHFQSHVITCVEECGHENCGPDRRSYEDTMQSDSFKDVKTAILSKLKMHSRPEPLMIEKIRNEISTVSMNRLRRLADDYLRPYRDLKIASPARMSDMKTDIVLPAETIECHRQSLCLAFYLLKSQGNDRNEQDMDVFERYDSRSYISLNGLKFKHPSVQLPRTDEVDIKIYVSDLNHTKISRLSLSSDEWTTHKNENSVRIKIPLPLRLKYPVIYKNYTRAARIILQITGLKNIYDLRVLDSFVSINYGSPSTDLDDERRNSRRGRGISSSNKCISSLMCCLHTKRIYFQLIKWTDWIIAPLYIDFQYCDGNCRAMNPNGTFYNSLLRALINVYGNKSPKPSLCCVPNKMGGFGMAYFNSQGIFSTGVIPDTIAEECICA